MDAQESQQQMDQFRLGQRVGDCLIKGCVVLVGTVESVAAPRPEPDEPDPKRAVMFRDVRLTVTEWLHGKGESNDVTVVAASAPEFSKTNLGPWLAWEGVTIDRGAPLVVLRWAPGVSRPDWHGTAEDVALAVSDPRRFEPIRQAIVQHHRFQENPGAIWAAVRLFQEQTKADPLVKGYVVTYLMDAASVGQVDATAKVLAAFLGDAGVPDQGRPQLADWLASSFYRLDEPTRKSVTETVVASAGADDRAIADGALTVLTKLSDIDMLDMKAFLTPAGQQKIAANYRAFQARTKSTRSHAALESQLGLR